MRNEPGDFPLSGAGVLAHQSHLEEQLEQVKELSAAALEHEKVKAENERRARELEEARQLQLSMLPKGLPDLPHLDIAADIKTASEVGGKDYYDFHTSEDGTLTIVVGDANGTRVKGGHSRVIGQEPIRFAGSSFRHCAYLRAH